MAEQLAEGVSDSTETIQSSTDGTQPEGQEQEAPQTEQERIDWRKRQREDVDLNAHIQSEISKARKRWDTQQRRARASDVAESPDVPEHARAVLQEFASEQDEPDEDESRDANWQQAAARVQPQLEDLLDIDTSGRATNPYYVELHKKHGAADMDKRYAEDPVAFVKWVKAETFKMAVSDEVKRATPAMAGAMAQDEAHRQLRGMTAPLGGSGAASGALTLESYERMSFEQRQKIRKENPRLIDDMIARAGQ